MFFRFVTNHECDRRTDKRTDRQNCDPQDRASIYALRSNKKINKERKRHCSKTSTVAPLYMRQKVSAIFCQQWLFIKNPHEKNTQKVTHPHDPLEQADFDRLVKRQWLCDGIHTDLGVVTEWPTLISMRAFTRCVLVRRRTHCCARICEWCWVF